jgi:hypothetical protein
LGLVIQFLAIIVCPVFIAFHGGAGVLGFLQKLKSKLVSKALAERALDGEKV